MPAPRKFKVGDTVWAFDENRRVYGKKGGGPIYAEHWTEYRVREIEKKSYLISRVYLSNIQTREVAIGFQKAEKEYSTTAEKNDDVYRKTTAHALSELVRRADAATLRQVAKLLGYKAKQQQ